MTSVYIASLKLTGTQKSRLTQTVLLSTQNMLKLMDKKIVTLLRSKILFIDSVISLPAHPASFVHYFVTGMQSHKSFISVSPRMQ